MRNPCPNCNSRTGYAEYQDGTYCHKCHKKGSLNHKCETKNKELLLPTCTRETIPDFCQSILDYIPDGYYKNQLYWNDYYKRLCFDYRMHGVRLGTWMRGFKEVNTDIPKWLFAGTKNNFSWLLPNLLNPAFSCCLVEDVISAIKLNQFMDVICLGGTSLSKSDEVVLQKYKTIYLFLDNDDAGRNATKKIRNKLKLNHEVIIVNNKKDPKEYSLEEIEELLK